MKSTSLILCLATAAFAFQPRAQAASETWKIDPAHSSVGFNVRHFISKVPGWFTTFEGSIVFDKDNLEASKAVATIQSASVTTNNGKRDNHLRTGDFFLVETFPTLKFTSTSWKRTGEDTYDVTGDLTIKDITKPVTLTTKFIGTAAGPRGATISAWEASAKIDRRDYGLTYGPGVVGNEVEIVIAVEAVKQ